MSNRAPIKLGPAALGRAALGRAALARVALGRPALGRAALAWLVSSLALATATASSARAASFVTVGPAAASGPIAPGFLGFSFEYPTVEAYAGRDPAAVDPVLERLIANLTPDPVIRIGGQSADWSWWPVAGMARPRGVSITLDRRWLRVTRTLAQELGARLILDVNMEANSARVARAEGRAFLDGFGAGLIQALELGNEPELYGIFNWGPSGRLGRPRPYDFSGAVRDFSRLSAGLPPLPLAGPAMGIPDWFKHLGRFLAAEPRVRVATLHRYPLQACYLTPPDPAYPTLGHLFSPRASRGLANSVAPYATLSHYRGVQLRVDEMNSAACRGAPGISDAFASALWATDALFEMARVGVDGVNIHTLPGSVYQPFSFRRSRGRWQASVHPLYYGLLLFAQAAPEGSRLLKIRGALSTGLKAWATQTGDGAVRVVLINEALARGRDVVVRVPGRDATATLDRMLAPSVRSKRGVTLGGQSFGSPTETGVLGGRARIARVLPANGGYVVRVPPVSAAMLTLR